LIAVAARQTWPTAIKGRDRTPRDIDWDSPEERRTPL
jgi:hypothetical protein